MVAAKKPAILVVDDEPGITVTLALILEESGYEVVTAASSDSAIRAVGSVAFDAALIDVHLPRFGRHHSCTRDLQNASTLQDFAADGYYGRFGTANCHKRCIEIRCPSKASSTGRVAQTGGRDASKWEGRDWQTLLKDGGLLTRNVEEHIPNRWRACTKRGRRCGLFKAPLLPEMSA